MKRRLIITESQLVRLKQSINETAHAILVKQIKQELDANYEPTSKFSRKGGDYSNMPMLKIKIDEEIISYPELLKYLKSKYPASDKFIIQVIKDWVDGSIGDNFSLSKNIAVN